MKRPDPKAAALSLARGVGASLAKPAKKAKGGEAETLLDSTGKPVHHTPEGVEAFKQWFGDSKSVDEQGRPVVLYRGVVGGANQGINADALNAASRTKDWATFATTSPSMAATYGAPDFAWDEAGALVPVYVKANKLIEFPVKKTEFGSTHDKFEFDMQASRLRPGEVLVARNVIDTGPRAHEAYSVDKERQYSYPADIYAWGPGTEVKSAVGNDGTFDHPTDITKAEGGPVEDTLLDSTGKPVHHTPEGVEAFKRWHEGSQVVDGQGRPLRVYHGSPEPDLTEISKTRTAHGFFFTPDRDTASYYTGKDNEGKVYEAYLNVKNLADFDDPAVFDKVAREAVDYNEERDREAVQGFAARLYNEGYGKHPEVTKFFDSQTGIEEVGEHYPIEQLLNDNYIDAGEIDPLVSKLPDNVRRAYDEAAPVRSKELEEAEQAYGSQDFYMNYQDDFMHAAKAMGYDGVVMSDPSSTGEPTSYVVFNPGQIKSATDNDGTWDHPTDITKAGGGKVESTLLDSTGKPVHHTPEGVEAFKRWHEGSKVVDEQGRPLQVYHGSIRHADTDTVKNMGDIYEFDRLFSTKFRRPSVDTMGSWFSTNPGEQGAEMYSGSGAGSVIYPVYLSIKNPHETTFRMMERRARLLANGEDDGRKLGEPEVNAYRQWLSDMGKDGVKIVHDEGNERGSTEFKGQDAWIALEPGQIKSAVGNDGTFDHPADITKAKGGEVETVKGPEREQNLKNWLGNSFLHDNGVPRTYYHGTSKDKPFTSFNIGRHGAWFTADPDEASTYARENDSMTSVYERGRFVPRNTASRVMPVYLKAENPFFGDRPEKYSNAQNYKKAQSDWFDELRAAGYDSWIPQSQQGNLAVMLGGPHQVKSAIGNDGTFDHPTDIAKAEGGEVESSNPDHLNMLAKAASDQRGGPEVAMTQAQRAIGGGVLSFCLEHVGDIYNRMHNTGYGGLDQYGPTEERRHVVLDKVAKTLRTLNQSYGFEREHEENLKANEQYNAENEGQSPEAYRTGVDAALKKYAEEHSKLPVYNRPQELARAASIALGEKDFRKAASSLSELKDMAEDHDLWHQEINKVNDDLNHSTDITKAEGGEVSAPPPVTPESMAPQPAPRKFNAIGLYSHAAEQARALPQQKGPLQQMLSTLRNRGVKEDEIAHSGVIEQFADKPFVTRDELADHFESRIPSITPNTEKNAYQNWSLKKGNNVLAGKNYREHLLTYDNQDQYNNFIESHWRDVPNILSHLRTQDFQKDVPNRIRWEHPTLNRVMELNVPSFRNERQTKTLEVGDVGIPGLVVHKALEGKKHEYTLTHAPSGLAIVNTVPYHVIRKFVDQIRPYNIDWTKSADEVKASVPDEVKKLSQDASNRWEQYFPPDEKRTSRGYRKRDNVLLMDEVQSDWGQKARDYGIRGDKDDFDARMKDYENLISKREDAFNAYQQANRDYLRKRENLGESDQQDKQSDELSEAKLRSESLLQTWYIFNEVAERAEKNLGSKRVPRGPYIDNTEKWSDLSLKYALKKAVDEGKTHLAWTPSKVQSDRYGAATQELVDSFNVTHHPDTGTFVVSPMKNGESVYISKLSEKYLLPRELKEIIGKDLTDLVTQNNPENYVAEMPSGAYRYYKYNLEGPMSVGKSGQEFMYDRLIPKRLLGLARQHDPEAKLTTYQGEHEPIKGFPALEITPRMAQSIKENGFKAFKRGGEVEGVDHALRVARQARGLK